MKKSEKKSGERDLAGRLKAFRNNFKGGMSQRAFAEELGLDQQRLSSYEMGTRVPHHVVAQLVRLGASASWLLFGEGAMFAESEKEKTVRELNLRVCKGAQGSFDDSDVSDFFILPLYADEAAAGEPLEMRDTEIEGPAIIHRDWCPHPEATDYVRISRTGTSMEPTIPAGAIVTVDRSINVPEELVGKIVCIALRDGGVTIKRLRRTERGGYVGQPDNPTEDNRPIYLEDGDRVVGKVTTVHARLD